MKVYCPCEKKCSGYMGITRKCTLIEVSAFIPFRFNGHIETLETELMGSGVRGFVGGILGGVGAGIFSSKSDITRYEVWECPSCKCEVLYKTTEQEKSKRMEKMGEISSCKE